VKSVTMYNISSGAADNTIGKSVILVFDIDYKYFLIFFIQLFVEIYDGGISSCNIKGLPSCVIKSKPS